LEIRANQNVSSITLE